LGLDWQGAQVEERPRAEGLRLEEAGWGLIFDKTFLGSGDGIGRKVLNGWRLDQVIFARQG
jgi:hypothetical protein